MHDSSPATSPAAGRAGEPVQVEPAAPSGVRWWVLAALCSAAVIAYIQRTSISVLKLPIQEELGLDKEQLGRVMSGFFLCYALSQVPLGQLGLRWGSRAALAAYAAMWSAGTAVAAWALGWKSLLVIWCLVGTVQGGLFPTTMIAVREWLPANCRALASGLLGACMSLGGAVGTALAGLLLWLGCAWTGVFAVFALPGLIFAAAFYWWFRDRPEQHPAVNPQELAIVRTLLPGEQPAGPAAIKVPWRRLLTRPAMWWIAGQHLCRATGHVFFLTSFPEYLKETYGVSAESSGAWAALPLLAVVVGSPLGGWASDRLLTLTGSRRASRQLLAVVGLAAAGLCTLATLGVADVRLVVLAMSGATFCHSFGGANGYTITLDMGGRYSTSVFSLMNTAGSLGATVFPWTVGWFVARTGRWDLVTAAVAAIFAAGAVFWLLLDPNGTVIEEEARSAELGARNEAAD